MADLELIRLALADASAQHDELAIHLSDLSVQIAGERSRLTASQADGDADQLAATQVRITDLVGQRAATSRAIGDLHERYRLEIDPLLGDDLELEGDLPLVLLPVRIETRSTLDQQSVRVRIFHDAVHAETLDEGLSQSESCAAMVYWNAVWDDADTASPWQELIAAVGGRRAPWAAEAMRPTNLASRGAQPPEFPQPAPPSARPAVARTLPDRFYVRIEQDGAAPFTVAGKAIPDELPIGLADRDEFSALRIDGQDLPPVDESLRWLVNYDEAVRIGMAVTIPLPLPGQTIRRLTVYGVRASLDSAASSARLERLIRSHRFTDGAEFVAQGTPTNNTDSVRSEWSRRVQPGPPDLSATKLDPGANAAVVAKALGVNLAFLATLPAGGDDEQRRAAAFNTALWTTTWGDAIEHLTPSGRANGDQRLDSPSLDAVRDHWVDHVRGRGPLPALRLGRQPYGLLPIVATDRSWKPRRGDFVERRLVPFIDQQVRWMWRDGQAGVPTVMNRPLDSALPEILGTDATLRGLRVRTALSADPVFGAAMALTLPDLGDPRATQGVTKALLLLAGVDSGALDEHDLLGKKTRTLALPLVHETDLDFVAELMQPDPANRSPHSVLQVLLGHAALVERHQRATLAPAEWHGILRESVGATTVEVDRDLLSGALDAVLEGESFADPIVADAAQHVSERVGRLDARQMADRFPIPAIAPESAVQKVAGVEPRFERLRGNLGIQLVGEIFQGARWAAGFQDALETISGIGSMDERRRLLSETLDCCSHRLDAWVTSAASRRLHDVRTDHPGGVCIGAYGWLENIELRTPRAAGRVDSKEVLHDQADGGFVHAPGLTHAATAGVLRSGRLSHRRGDPSNEALDIDLSSGRTRDALALLDGMRRGQSLGALLGYRLERRLHERSGGGLELDRFIYVLRALAPLRGGKLTEPGLAVEESLAASDVVDGLRLMAISPGEITAKLVSGPDDTKYIVPPDVWMPPQLGEAEAILAAIQELERTHDAVADLLLAEAVHQIVSGNPARAAAALDVLGAGEAVPPDPEVVRTPRSGIPLQHRVAVVIPDGLPGPVAGWDSDRPRALAEPSLEAWAERALGNPTESLIAVGHHATLADCGLSALDVLYDADSDSVDKSALVARLRRRFADLGEDLSPLAPVWELAGLLRAMLVTGRPLDVADLGRPVEQGAVGRLPDTAELLGRATAATDALRAAVALADPFVELADFGVRPPPRIVSLELSEAEKAAANEALLEAARTRLAQADQLLARAELPAPTKTVVELASQALTAVFGGGFMTLARLLPPPLGESDLWAGATGPGGVSPRAGADIRPWLARAGTLRPSTSGFGETVLVRESLGRRPQLRVVQTPAGAYRTWVGLPFPDARPPMVPLASMIVEVAGVLPADPEPDLAGAVAGFVVDEWTEVVPRRLERHDPADPAAAPELVDVTTTGLAVNANAPGARPPQAILIALSSDGAGWTGDRLVQVLDEASALARMRGVTLQDLPYAGRYLPALYFRDWSLQGEPVIDWLTVAAEFRVDHALQYLKVEQ